jgi:hypothetical protein
LQPVLIEGFSPIRLPPDLWLAGQYGLSRNALPGAEQGPSVGDVMSVLPDVIDGGILTT